MGGRKRQGGPEAGRGGRDGEMDGEMDEWRDGWGGGGEGVGTLGEGIRVGLCPEETAV